MRFFDKNIRLSGSIAFDHQIPLPGRDQRRSAAINANPDFRQLNRPIGAAVGWPLETAPKLQARYRRTTIIARLDLQHRIAIRTTLNMGVDLPVPRVLIMRGCDLLLVAETCAIGAVDLRPRQGVDRKLHHQKINGKHHAEKPKQRQEHKAPGQRLWRS